MRSITFVSVLFLISSLIFSCSDNTGKVVTTESGLQYVDLVAGKGDTPKIGQKVSAHYIGTLEDGKKFDSSYDRNSPIEFTVGVKEMIPGFDEGVMTMKKGGKRKLIIPAELGYGSKGIPGVIPANATIIFEVELVDIK